MSNETIKPVGPSSYSERRLLEIAKAADSIAFWVRLWSILSVLAFVLWIVVMAANS